MPTATNAKVKFGVKNVYYAPETSSGWGTPVALPGAVSLTLSVNENSSVFRADDVNYYVTRKKTGYEGSFEAALIPDAFRKACLGEVEGSDGTLYEPVNPTLVKFALGFEIEGVADDGTAMSTLMWVYNCLASGTSIEAETTSEDSNEPKTETIEFTTEPNDQGHLRAKLQTAPSGTAYTDWFTSVKEYTAPSQ